MNENSPNSPSTSTSHHGLTAEAISRRAYQLWEEEGRPENRDRHHWLRAEKELLAEQKGESGGAEKSGASESRPGNTDVPMQGSRNAAPVARPPSSPAAKRSPESAGGRMGQPGSQNPGRRSGGK